jgi:hypothetical protein
MRSQAWTPLPAEMTRPDQIDQEAFDLLPLMEGEQIRACWRMPSGFLVMTDLRCLAVHYVARIFGERGWHLGSIYYFYNLSPPEVVRGRYVQLREPSYGTPGGERFAVANAQEVCQRIAEAIEPGRREWELYRSMYQSGRQERARAREFTMSVRGPPCPYCGNPVAATDHSCPSCGAPRP